MLTDLNQSIFPTNIIILRALLTLLMAKANTQPGEPIDERRTKPIGANAIQDFNLLTLCQCWISIITFRHAFPFSRFWVVNSGWRAGRQQIDFISIVFHEQKIKGNIYLFLFCARKIGEQKYIYE